MINTFRNKITQEQIRQNKSSMMRMDMIRFVLLVLVAVMLGMIYKIENISQKIQMALDNNYEVGKNSEVTLDNISSNEEKLVRKYNNELMQKYVNYFPEIDQDNEMALGSFVEEKGGYLGNFDKVNTFFELLMPYLYSNELVFSKNEVSVTMSPVGSDAENDVPQIENNKLIYDNVYPGVMAIRKFTSKGMNEYLILKDQSAAKILNYRLIINGGKARIVGDKLYIVDELNNREIKLMNYQLLDANMNNVGEVSLNQIGVEVVEVRLNFDENVQYPLILISR